ncbi:MAG: PilX N-terminal domain-containing pilus assembly protein [Gammaproteobacteria bacterium]
MKTRNGSSRSRQRGVVLVVSLMILLVMTVIGITATQSSSLEERMAGNARDHNLAFQAAESAIRDAENFLDGIVSTAPFNGTGGLYGPTDVTPNPLLAATWAGDVLSYTDTPLEDIKTQPRYFIRQVGDIEGTAGALNLGPGYGQYRGSGDVTTFKIFARGTGGNDTTQVMLVSHFGRTGL